MLSLLPVTNQKASFQDRFYRYMHTWHGHSHVGYCFVGFCATVVRPVSSVVRAYVVGRRYYCMQPIWLMADKGWKQSTHMGGGVGVQTWGAAGRGTRPSPQKEESSSKSQFQKTKMKFKTSRQPNIYQKRAKTPVFKQIPIRKQPPSNMGLQTPSAQGNPPRTPTPIIINGSPPCLHATHTTHDVNPYPQRLSLPSLPSLL